MLAAAFFSPRPAETSPFRHPTLFSRLRKEFLLPALLLLFGAAGMARYQQFRAEVLVGEEFVNSHAGWIAAAELEILALPEASFGGGVAGTWNAPAKLTRFAGKAVNDVNLRIYGTGPFILRRGDRIIGEKLRLYPLDYPVYPGAFTFRDLRRAEGVAGSARLRGAYQCVGAVCPGGWRGKISTAWRDFRRALDEIRARGVRAILRLYPDERGALLAAVTLGWLENLPPAVTENFRCSGLGHVLAISGLHVGLVAMLAWFLARIFLPGRRAQAAAVLLGIGVFVALSGARPSAVRAGAVALLCCGGIICARPAGFLNSLGIAALFIWGENPETLFSAGFQLSYVAVLFIYCGSAEAERWLGRFNNTRGNADVGGTGNIAETPQPDSRARNAVRRAGLWGLGAAGVCVAAWLGTWPIVARYFNLCSYGGLLINPFAVMLLTFILPGGAAGLLLAPWAGLIPGWLTDMVAWPVSGMLWLAEFTARWRESWDTVFAPPGWSLAVYYGIFALFFCRRAVSKRLAEQKNYWWAAGLLLAIGAAALYTFVSTFYGKARPGVYAFPGKAQEVFLVVSPERRLTAVFSESERNWSALRNFCLYLGFRQVDRLIIPENSEPAADFVRRIPCREIMYLPVSEGGARMDLPGGGKLSFRRADKKGYVCHVRQGLANVLAIKGLRDKQLAAVQAAETPDAAVLFLRRTGLARFSAGRGWFGADCRLPARVAEDISLRPREKWGYVKIDAATGIIAAYPFAEKVADIPGRYLQEIK